MQHSRLHHSNRQFLTGTMILAFLVLVLVFAMMFLATSCSNNSFTATGECSDSLHYAYYSHDYFNSDAVDSIPITDGAFTLSGQADTIGFCVVATEDGHTWMFFTEPGDITLHPEGYVSGTPLNDAYHQLALDLNAANTDDDAKQLFSQFVTEHHADLSGAIAVLKATDYFKANECVTLLEQLSPDMQAKTFVVVPREAFYHEDKVKPGDMFTDFEVEYDGKLQRLSDYVGQGNYTLVDFWASWCGPCKAEVPNIQKLYEDFGDKGLTVLGVATWDKPEDTMKAIDELGITYPQILDAQKVGSDAYDFDGIPMIILFAPDGTVLYKDLRGDDLVNKVSALFQ